MIPAGFVEGILDEAALGGTDAVMKTHSSIRRRRMSFDDGFRKVFRNYHFGLAKHDRSLNRVLQLTNISRPVISPQAGFGFSGNPSDMPAVTIGISGGKIVRKQPHIAFALPERR